MAERKIKHCNYCKHKWLTSLKNPKYCPRCHNDPDGTPVNKRRKK